MREINKLVNACSLTLYLADANVLVGFSYICSIPINLCVCVFSSHLFWTPSSLDVPAGVTQKEGHTGFLIHLPSAVHAFIFLVDREVEFCVLTIESFSTCWASSYIYIFIFLFCEEKKKKKKKKQVPGFELTYQRERRLRR